VDSVSIEAVTEYLRAELGVDERTSTHVHVLAEKCVICQRLRKALACAEGEPEAAGPAPDLSESLE
jgi:hypothetical protein